MSDFLDSIHRMPPNKRRFLIAIAQGVDDETAAAEAGVKLDTVQGTWLVKDDGFKATRDLIRADWRAAEQLYRYAIRMGTLKSVAQEVSDGRTALDREGKKVTLSPRGSVLELGANMERMLEPGQQGGTPPAVQLNAMLQQLLVQSVAKQMLALQEQQANELVMDASQVKEFREAAQ